MTSHKGNKQKSRPIFDSQNQSQNTYICMHVYVEVPHLYTLSYPTTGTTGSIIDETKNNAANFSPLQRVRLLVASTTNIPAYCGRTTTVHNHHHYCHPPLI
jgi:hypothetical protein